MIRLGQQVRDVVSGLEGVVVARIEWLNGCIRFCIQPPKDKDGKVPDSVTIDWEQLEVLDEGTPVVLPGRPTREPEREPAQVRTGGGGRNDAAALART